LGFGKEEEAYFRPSIHHSLPKVWTTPHRDHVLFLIHSFFASFLVFDPSPRLPPAMASKDFRASSDQDRKLEGGEEAQPALTPAQRLETPDVVTSKREIHPAFYIA
jgi:hypothetical protein